jgi:hypothetical protein
MALLGFESRQTQNDGNTGAQSQLRSNQPGVMALKGPHCVWYDVDSPSAKASSDQALADRFAHHNNQVGTP